MCNSGFLLEGNVCASCDVTNCEACSQVGNCTSCMNNLQVINGTCQACVVENCAICSAENVCANCSTNFQLVNATCQPFSCAVANCTTCADNDVCGICFTLFSLTASGTCLSCNVSNCANCSAADVCSACQLDFQLTGEVCILCAIPNCLACDSTAACVNCSEGFSAVQGQCAPSCPTSCNSTLCNNITGTCLGCQTGFTLNHVLNQCFTCGVTNCIECSSDNVCSICANTFILANNECGCPANSVLISNGTQCGCEGNFTFNPSDFSGTVGLCLANCGITDCINCPNTDASGNPVCVECKLGYQLLNNTNTCGPFC